MLVQKLSPKQNNNIIQNFKKTHPPAPDSQVKNTLPDGGSSILYGDKFKTKLDPTQRELNRDSIHDWGTIRDWIQGKAVVRRHGAPAIQQTINNTKNIAYNAYIFVVIPICVSQLQLKETFHKLLSTGSFHHRIIIYGMLLSKRSAQEFIYSVMNFHAFIYLLLFSVCPSFFYEA